MPKNAAGITIKSDWIKRNGFNTLFKGVYATSTGNFVVKVTEYSLEDHFYVEIKFYPPSLNGHWLKMYVPRSAVEAIAITQTDEDASLIGFKEER